jgi:hypothetical protein
MVRHGQARHELTVDFGIAQVGSVHGVTAGYGIAVS